jgi:cell division protein FtsW
MARTLRSDKLLFLATLLLVGSSVVMVYSASAVQALVRYESPAYFLSKQLAWVAIGLGMLLVGMRIDYHTLRRPSVIWTLVSLTIAALLAVFLFEERNSTQRWLTFGAASFQPSELAKFTAVVFAAALLERRMHRVNDFGYALAPIVIVALSLAGLIVYEPDFGTAAVLVAVVTAVVFGAGLTYRYLLGGVLVLAPIAMGLILTAEYRSERLVAFLNPDHDPTGTGYQLNQSLIAIGSGGGFGRGLMGGVQKLFYIPEPHNDFIYAVIGEEFGLVGTTLILACFVLIAWRGLRAALLAPDRFGSLLAIGLTMMITLQAFVNMSVVLGLLPTKGLPLPFVSSGGSSLVISFVAMGVLLNISQQASGTAGSPVEGRE